MGKTPREHLGKHLRDAQGNNWRHLRKHLREITLGKTPGETPGKRWGKNTWKTRGENYKIEKKVEAGVGELGAMLGMPDCGFKGRGGLG